MKLKTLLALDILNNSAASAQQLKWAKMTDEEKMEARRNLTLAEHWKNLVVYTKLFLVFLAIAFWYVSIPTIIIGYIIYKIYEHYKFEKHWKERSKKCGSQKEQ